MWIIIGPMQYWSKGRSNMARILFANHCEPQCLLKWPEEPLKWTKYKCNIHTVPSPAGINWTSLFVRSCNSQISHPTWHPHTKERLPETGRHWTGQWTLLTHFTSTLDICDLCQEGTDANNIMRQRSSRPSERDFFRKNNGKTMEKLYGNIGRDRSSCNRKSMWRTM